MATVLVDRYRVFCERCGFADDFMVGGAIGSFHACMQGIELHRQAQPMCPASRAPHTGVVVSALMEAK